MAIHGTAWGGWAGGIAFVLILGVPHSQDKAADYLVQYNRERDPVRKAKLLSKLGAEQTENCRKQAAAGHFASALTLLGEYRDEVISTQKELDATGKDAEKRPAGFKQLQISVRESLRELNEILLNVPNDWREPFEGIRAQLERVNKELMLELFPRQPGHSAKGGKTKP